MLKSATKALAGPFPGPEGRSVERRTLVLLLALFLLPALAAKFISQAIPAFMRQTGHSEAMIGLIFLAGVPLMLSFVWAPLVDRYGWSRLGYRRGWILFAQIAIVLAFGLFFFVDPGDRPWLLIAVGGGLMACVGTQIAATSGWMLDILPAQDHPTGSAIFAASGGFAGLLLGFAVLFLFGDLGWQACILVLLSAGAAGVLLIVFHPIDRHQALPYRTTRPSVWASLAIVRRREVVRTFLLVQLMDANVTLTFILRPILQVDAGMSISEIGLIGVIGSNAIGVLAAAATAPVVRRVGPWATFAFLSASALVINGLLAWSLSNGVTQEVAIFFVLASGAIGFVGYTAGRALFMGFCTEGRHATDFMTLLSLDGAAALMVAVLGSMIADRFGTASVFAVAMMAAAVALFVAIIVARRQEPRPSHIGAGSEVGEPPGFDQAKP